MDIPSEYELDDLDERDMDTIINHLCISTYSTNVIGEFCGKDVELIRQNIFTKFKELKFALAIIKAYRTKTVNLQNNVYKLDSRVKELEESNNELQHKLNMKEKLLNELLAFDEINNQFPREKSINRKIHSNSFTINNPEFPLYSIYERSGLHGMKCDTSSSDFDQSNRESFYQLVRNRNGGSVSSRSTSHVMDIAKDNEDFNFYVEKMHELCLSSKNLTLDERNVIEQLVAHFSDYINQNRYMNEFLNSNIEDAIQQKEEISNLLVFIQKLEDEKRELMNENDQMSIKINLLTKELNESNQKLEKASTKCDFCNDYVVNNESFRHYNMLNMENLKNSINDMDNIAVSNTHDFNLANDNASTHTSPSKSFSLSKTRIENSTLEESDSKKPISSKLHQTPKFKLVKSMEGSNMLNKWKNLATTSRGLQITKDVYNQSDSTEPVCINNMENDAYDSEHNEFKTSLQDMVNTPTPSEATKNLKKGPKIIPIVTKIGHLHKVATATTSSRVGASSVHTDQYFEAENISKSNATINQSKNIISRFGSVDDSFQFLNKKITTENERTTKIPNDNNLEMTGKSNNLIEDLLKNLDYSMNTVVNQSKLNESNTSNVDDVKEINQTNHDKDIFDSKNEQKRSHFGVSKFLSFFQSPFH